MSKKRIDISNNLTEFYIRELGAHQGNFAADLIIFPQEEQSKENYWDFIGFKGDFVGKSISPTSYEILNSQLFENFTKDIKRPKPSETEVDLSEYNITSEGVINESWVSVVLIPSKIIEVNKEFILMECLVDYENKILETRKFKRSLIENKCVLKLSNIILLKVSEKPGKMVFEFEDAKNLGYEKFFVEEEYLDGIDDLDTGKLIR